MPAAGADKFQVYYSDPSQAPTNFRRIMVARQKCPKNFDVLQYRAADLVKVHLAVLCAADLVKVHLAALRAADLVKFCQLLRFLVS